MCLAALELLAPHIRNGKRNARLRLIFENGTEGENLLRSLATELYKDPSGRRISNPAAGGLFEEGAPQLLNVAPTGQLSGCVYVVKSLSDSPAVRALEGRLYKIGFTSGELEDRIRGAKDDPTFLFAPVQPVRKYDAYNINVGRLETLLHRFFAEARWDIELPDRFGRPFKPHEWFSVPISVIEQVVPMMLDGSVTRYRYDEKKGPSLAPSRPKRRTRRSKLLLLQASGEVRSTLAHRAFGRRILAGPRPTV